MAPVLLEMAGEEMEVEPLDSIAESVVPHDDTDVVATVPPQVFCANQPGLAGNLPTAYGHGFSEQQPSSGSGINLCLTPAGIRAILARKTRSKPLLKIICKGCGLSTHDKDIFIPIDFLECLDCMPGTGRAEFQTTSKTHDSLPLFLLAPISS